MYHAHTHSRTPTHSFTHTQKHSTPTHQFTHTHTHTKSLQIKAEPRGTWRTASPHRRGGGEEVPVPPRVRGSGRPGDTWGRGESRSGVRRGTQGQKSLPGRPRGPATWGTLPGGPLTRAARGRLAGGPRGTEGPRARPGMRAAGRAGWRRVPHRRNCSRDRSAGRSPGCSTAGPFLFPATRVRPKHRDRKAVRPQLARAATGLSAGRQPVSGNGRFHGRNLREFSGGAGAEETRRAEEEAGRGRRGSEARGSGVGGGRQVGRRSAEVIRETLRRRAEATEEGPALQVFVGPDGRCACRADTALFPSRPRSHGRVEPFSRDARRSCRIAPFSGIV